MSSNDHSVNESVDDGFSSRFFQNFIENMDKTALQVVDDSQPTEQGLQERLRQFNEGWNISLADSEAATTSTRVAAPDNVMEVNASAEDPDEGVQQSILTSVVKNIYAGQQEPSSLQYVDDDSSIPPTTNNTEGVASNSNSMGHMPPLLEFSRNRISNRSSNVEKRHRSCSENDSREEDDCDRRQRKVSHCRRPRSHYYSRSRSRSRESRRRRHRYSSSRGHPRSRSRSLSRSPRSSHSSELESRHRSRSRRNRSSAKPVAPAAAVPHPDMAMMQSMMAMTLQMLNQAMAVRSNPTQPVMGPVGVAPQTAPNVQIASAIMSQAPIEQTINRSSTLPLEENSGKTTELTANGTEKETPYDVSAELFLESKLSVGDYLALRPSSKEQRGMNPKVCERIKEAISVLDRQETKEQTAKFLYVPPTYYRELRKKDSRSPLIWNERNVLFGLTCSSREVKLCEPFGNVNGNLKALIAKLGLDEGVISQQLQKVALVSADNAGRAILPERASTGIQAISTLPRKPGHAKVRHVIERAVQTEGYACDDCVHRGKRTFVCSSSQTNATRKTNVAVQTPGEDPKEQRNVPTITLENLTSSQIETIDAIVRFIRTRHVTGPVDSVQHALYRDSTIRGTMGESVFHSTEELLANMTGQPRPSSSGVVNRYATNFQVQVPQNQPTTSAKFQQLQPVAKSGSRYGQSFNVISPACFVQEPAMSKRARKRANRK